MNTRVPRIISVPLLGALVATALVAAPAQAAEPNSVASFSELTSAFQSGGKYQLTGNIYGAEAFRNPLAASTSDPVELDMNGFEVRLHGDDTGPALEIHAGADVTVTDSAGGGRLSATTYDRNAAAIGTGDLATGTGDLTVDGPLVTAYVSIPPTETQNAATIGGGRGAEGLDLEVISGRVTAETAAKSNGPAIGSGGNASGGSFYMTGGSVTANGRDKGAGIGGGTYGDGLHYVTIAGGEVIAKGGVDAAGIGTGAFSSGGPYVTISGGKVFAEGGANGAGIGGGNGGDAYWLVIKGGDIDVWGGENAAGIGGGYLGDGGAVSIEGGSLAVKGGKNASTIGAGARNPVTTGSTETERGSLTVLGQKESTAPTVAGGPHGVYVDYDTSSATPVFMVNREFSDSHNTLVEFGHRVNFDAQGGSPSGHVQFVLPGATAEEPPPPVRAGHAFLGWFDGATNFDFGTAVTESLSLKAKWQPSSYDVKFNTNGGSSVSTQKVDHGDTADKPATPARLGYKFEAWQSGGSNYSFGNPVTGPLTLTAKWKQNAVIPFIDVSSNTSSVYYSQFHKEINWLASAGISKGWNVGGGKYEYRPYDEITREAMAAFMYRFAGSPAVSLPAKSPFSDVTPNNTNFYKEIVWMNQQGISTGWHMSNGKQEFRPKDEITRDAMAAFMYRFAGKPATTPPAKSPFTDLPKSSQFYKEVTWLANTGISKGWTMGGGKYEYRPYNEITRDAMAAFMFRFDKI